MEMGFHVEQVNTPSLKVFQMSLNDLHQVTVEGSLRSLSTLSVIIIIKEEKKC